MCRLLVLLAALTSLLLPPPVHSISYNNEWAAEVPGGERAAREVAEHTGCSLHGEVIPGSSVFQFKCHHVRRRSTEQHDEVNQQLDSHHHVTWSEQQQVKSRQKRQGLWGSPQQWRMPPQQHRAQPEEDLTSTAPYEDPLHFTDQRWPLMWYLNRGGRLDMNVLEAWQDGITGKGVVVTILDDGIERANPDLVANYDPQASYDVNDNDNDPTPRYDLIDSNRHGTRCAGEVSASANNTICAVGIAYDSKIGGVRMLDGDVTDAVEARSISLNNQHIDIYSASWGPDDDGKTVDGPGTLASRAFINGIQSGRGGKGSIFVWASGNGGRDHDNCNCDGYTNSIWTLSVSSATENGLIPWYSEACSSTMASTYSSGSSGERKVVTTDLHNLCTSSHTGTSASAPMAAGVIALVLQANPSLTWRDVQHLTVRNAHVANLRATDWRVNAMGRNYSHSFGYGIMDASAMVRMARIWKTVPEQKISAVKADIGPIIIPERSSRSAKMEVTDHGEVNFLEHVQAHVTLTSMRRGDVQIYLISPGGTRSQLLARRPQDSSRAGFQDWPFLTVFCWGENPKGTWELEVQNDGRSQVELHKWTLTFHGTLTDPFPQLPPPPPPSPPTVPPPTAAPSPPPVPVVQTTAPKKLVPKPSPAAPPAPKPVAPVYEQTSQVAPVRPSQSPPISLPEVSNAMEHCTLQAAVSWCTSCEPGYLVLVGHCVSACPPEGYYQGRANNSLHCLPCYYSCRTCTGPNDDQCTDCYGDAQMEVGESGMRHCHNKGLLFKVMSSSRWYYLLSAGFLLNFLLVLCLVVYIYRRSKKGGSPGGVLNRGGKSGPRYSPMPDFSNGKSGGSGRALPFHDDDEDDSDEPSA